MAGDRARPVRPGLPHGRLDLDVLRTFLAVVRAGSFTRAAAEVRLSQPAVSAQIQTLERLLDTQLFRRLPRGIAPTAAAEELAVLIGEHVDALAQITSRTDLTGRILAPGTPFTRAVQLAGPAELIAVRVLPCLTDLFERGLTLRVTTGLAEELLAGLAARRFDLVISTIRPRGRGVTAVPLTDEEFVLVAAPRWRDRLTDAASARALAGVPMVAYAEDLPIIRRYWQSVFGTRPHGTPAIVVPDLRAVVTACVAGAGLSVVPRYLCADELRTGRLVALHEPAEPPINTLFLAHRAAASPHPASAAVHAQLTAQAPQW